MTGACRCGEDSIPGVVPDIVPRVAASACEALSNYRNARPSTSSMCPHIVDGRAHSAAGWAGGRQSAARLPAMSCGAHVGKKLRQRRAILLSVRERHHQHGVLLVICMACSAWRSDSWRGPHMRMPKWRHRLLSRRLARRSPPKLPSMPAGNTRRKHKRGCQRWTRRFRHRLITDATGC
ncbi:hypothetical protein TcCL_ESM07214 [Trypanosoma cruzi]|nr:hypothetical protein TcCL_ESM07214 [Trypanosoma cruzi]